MIKPAWILIALALSALDAGAEGPVQGPVNNPPVLIPYRADFDGSIALPSGGIYMTRGIYGSLAGGQNRKGNDHSIYQWQGEAGYFYTQWFSGGSQFKMVAGQPSDPLQVVKNRFFLFGRFHKSWARVTTFAGAEVGLEDLNLSLKPSNDTDLTEPLKKINAGMGLEMGVAWKFSPYVGFTLGQHFEASFVGDDTVNSDGSLNFRTAPGLALDVLSFAPSLRKNVKALYLFSEVQFGQLILEDRSKKRDLAWIAGATVAF